MKDRKLLRGLLIGLTALAAVLNGLPESHCMRFFAGENGYFYEYVSGYDPILMGYGNFGPMLTGVLSILFVVLELLRWNRESYAHANIALVAAFGASVLYIGLVDRTPWNWAVSGLLLAAVVVDCLVKVSGKKKGSEQ